MKEQIEKKIYIRHVFTKVDKQREPWKNKTKVTIIAIAIINAFSLVKYIDK